MSIGIAKRAYNRQVLWLSAAYAALLLPATYAFEHRLVGGALGVGVAILPALPILGLFAAIGRYLIDERDEYLRMLMVRQTLIASAFALTIATLWGFLEGFGIVRHVEAFYVAVLWFGGLGVGRCVNLLMERGA